MALSLPKPPQAYDAAEQAVTRRVIEVADKTNIKRTEALERLLFISPNGTKYYLSVSNAGAAVWTAA